MPILKTPTNSATCAGNPKFIFTDEDVILIEELAKELDMEQLGNFFGLDKRTLLNVRERQPEVNEAYMRGRAKGLKEMTASLYKRGIAGSDTAAIFYIKYRSGWRESDMFQIDIEDKPKLVINFVNEENTKEVKTSGKKKKVK